MALPSRSRRPFVPGTALADSPSEGGQGIQHHLGPVRHQLALPIVDPGCELRGAIGEDRRAGLPEVFADVVPVDAGRREREELPLKGPDGPRPVGEEVGRLVPVPRFRASVKAISAAAVSLLAASRDSVKDWYLATAAEDSSTAVVNADSRSSTRKLRASSSPAR